MNDIIFLGQHAIFNRSLGDGRYEKVLGVIVRQEEIGDETVVDLILLGDAPKLARVDAIRLVDNHHSPSCAYLVHPGLEMFRAAVAELGRLTARIEEVEAAVRSILADAGIEPEDEDGALAEVLRTVIADEEGSGVHANDTPTEPPADEPGE